MGLGRPILRAMHRNPPTPTAATRMPENPSELTPATPAASPSDDLPFSVRNAVLILLAVCAFIFFPALGARDLWAPDEPRFTEVAREMFLSGDYVVPRRNDKVYVKKPPLLFWCVTLLAKISGRVTEGVARIPSAVAATGLVLVTFLWGRAQLGARAGFLGALMLATAFRFYWNGRYVQTDMLFSFFCTSAVFCLYHAYVRQERPWLLYLVGYSSAGLGILAKGPLCVVLVVLALGPFMLCRQWSLRELPRFREFAPHLAGAVLCLVIALPWYLLSLKHAGGSEFAQKNLVRENLDRFFRAFDHKNPPWEYLKLLLLDFLPWSLFLPAGLVLLWRKRERDGAAPGIAWFLILWLGLSLLFFSASQSKQGKYLLPLYPGFALCVGWLCHESFAKFSRRERSRGVTVPLWVSHTTLGVAALLANLGIWLIGTRPKAFSGTVKPEVLASFGDGQWLGVLSAFALVTVSFVAGSIAGIFLLARRKHAQSVMGLCVMLVAAYLFASLTGLPSINQFKSARPICEDLKRVSGPEDRVGHLGSGSTNNAYVYYSGRFLEEIVPDARTMSQEVERFASEAGRAFLFTRRAFFDLLSDQVKAQWSIVSERRVGHRHMMLLCNREIAGPR